MDFHTLSRKELQALCKKNKIPANMTNAAMADALKALPHVVDGMEGIEEQFMSPAKPELFTPRPPRTSTRSSARTSSIALEKVVDEMERRPVTRSTRRSVKEEEEVKEITDGIAFMKVSDTPSAATGRKAPRAHHTANKAVYQKKELESTDLMVTPAATAQRSSARLRSKVTIVAQTPMAVKEEVIEENGGRTTRTRQSLRRRPELSLAKEKESAGDLVFPRKIQEQKVIVEEKNVELSGITVEAEMADASVAKPGVEIAEETNDSTLIPVVVETLDFGGESSEEILVTPFCCDDESKEEVLNADSGVGDVVDESTGKVEFDELPTEVDNEESLMEVSFENAVIELEDITVAVESNAEIPAIVGKVESDELSAEVEGSLEEISSENVAAMELEEFPDHDDEDISVEVATSETAAIFGEVKDTGAISPAEIIPALEVEGISYENIAATESEEPNHYEEETTVKVESSAETPAIVGELKEGGSIDGSPESTIALSPIRAEAIAATENLVTVDDGVATDLSVAAIFELSEHFAKAATSDPKTPISAKPHLVVLQDCLPTSTKKREKTVDENIDKENVGFNCNNNTINKSAKKKSTIKRQQQKEDQDLKVMSLRQLKLQYKKTVLSKKNLDNNENMEEEEVKKRAALTPLKENCMRSVSN